jgi:hypothetical protein
LPFCVGADVLHASARMPWSRSAEGANQMARLVSEGIKDLGLPISPYVK